MLQQFYNISCVLQDHYVNVARREAARRPGAVFADQFENLANMRAHMHTGHEILEQTDRRLDAFVSGAGTKCS